MSKIVSEQTEKAVLRQAGTNACLSHNTMSDTFLNYILKDNNTISLQASGLDYFWDNKGQRLPDDNQEFVGTFNLFDYLGFNLPLSQTAENLKKDANKVLDGNADPMCVASSTTPYILCFSTSLIDKNLQCRFCNESGNFAVSLLLDFNKLIDPTSITHIYKRIITDDKQEVEEEIKKVNEVSKEMMQVYYTDKPKFCKSSNAGCCHHKAMEELKSIPNESEVRRADEDYKIDACFYVKRSNFACEKEIRYIFRIKEHCKFVKTDEQKILFDAQTDNQTDNQNIQHAKNLLIHFDIEIVKGLVFGPCVDHKKAEEYASKLISKAPKLADIKFLLSDGTQFIPEQANKPIISKHIK